MRFGGGARGPYRQADYRDPDDSAANRHPPEDFGDAFSCAPSRIKRRLRSGATGERQRTYQENMSRRAISATATDASEKKVDDGMPFVLRLSADPSCDYEMDFCIKSEKRFQPKIQLWDDHFRTLLLTSRGSHLITHVPGNFRGEYISERASSKTCSRICQLTYDSSERARTAA